jgi:flagellar protein FliJ
VSFQGLLADFKFGLSTAPIATQLIGSCARFKRPQIFLRSEQKMKSHEMALRMKRFDSEMKARAVADLEEMIRNFEHLAADLNEQIQAEEQKTRMNDPDHPRYSPLAKLARTRLDNILASTRALRSKLNQAIRERNRVAAELEQAVNRLVEPGQPLTDLVGRSNPESQTNVPRGV